MISLLPGLGPSPLGKQDEDREGREKKRKEGGMRKDWKKGRLAPQELPDSPLISDHFKQVKRFATTRFMWLAILLS